VWFDSQEFASLVDHLKLPAADVLDIYAERVQSGWVKMKDKAKTDPKAIDQCVFLDKDGE
jgi:hypothetical protein